MSRRRKRYRHPPKLRGMIDGLLARPNMRRPTYPGEYDTDVMTSIVDDLLALREEAANV